MLPNGLKIRNINPAQDGDLYGVTSIDDTWVPINQMIKYYKYGFGRASDYVNFEIRNGNMTRKQGIKILQKFDGKCSEKLIKNFCKYIDISDHEFWNQISKYVNKNLFTISNQKNLSFKVGDSENIPLEKSSVDIVINVESSHCYGSFSGFLKEVSRVLRPGGRFLFCDFRPSEEIKPLLSEFDSRKRIYLASPGLWQGLSCVKGEMIIYPKGGTAPLHHHENAEHFQYIMEGTGTVTFENSEHIVEKGDILYFFENEVHAFENKDADEFVFAEFFVPGSYKTIWAKDANVCTWLPTGKDLRGRKAARHIEKHVAGEGTDI